MELKRSLEKAKLQQEALKPFADISGGGNVDIHTYSSGQTGTGWVPPVYSQSSNVHLDMELLKQNRIIYTFADTPEAEQYKILRTNIQRQLRANNWRTIMVTSALPGEGKTLTSINLSLSFAKEFNQTVLLVDSDFRRQSVYKYLGISSDRGIVDYLLERLDLNDLIVWPNIEKFTLISGGMNISDSSELIGSPRMKNMVNEIKQRYDDRLIIFDTPPVLAGADAIAFAPLVDCYIMVVEEGRTPIKEINIALDMLPKEKFLGFVLNKRKNSVSRYYY